jgi:hypothetical protein
MCENSPNLVTLAVTVNCGRQSFLSSRFDGGIENSFFGGRKQEQARVARWFIFKPKIQILFFTLRDVF